MMITHARRAVAAPLLPLARTLGLAIVLIAAALPASAQDFQSVAKGAVAPGSNGIILSGRPGASDDGICNDITPGLLVGDDVLRVAPGRSDPNQPAIHDPFTGGNGVINSIPAGDDALSAVICPGSDTVLQSVPAGDDQISTIASRLCQLCGPGAGACIVPGANTVLDTPVNPADILVPFVSTGADGIAQTTAAGDDVQQVAVGNGSPDTICVDAGPNHIADTTLCGNGSNDFQENGSPPPLTTSCDDGNNTDGDGCSSTCTVESGWICSNTINTLSVCTGFCGNGRIDPGEQCDDGNSRNDDACVLGCRNAFCGDGVIERGVEECEPPNTQSCDAACQTIRPARCGDRIVDPGEHCDDGNNSNQDDCLNTCQLPTCGDGFIHTKGALPFEECDDGNTTPGDGCSATCLRECGNGVIDGGCSEGTVGAACNDNTDCDTAPGAGDGVCVTEACDPGAANLCIPGPLECSNVCKIATCGNGEVECAEECDLGVANGVLGSGCSASCTRTVVGKNEFSNHNECPNAWTLDSPPGDLKQRTQTCSDGAPCDFDTIPGQCTFRVGVCLSRPGVAGCERGKLRTFELQGLKLDRPQEAVVIATITGAVADLAPGVSSIPDRCRAGARGQTCSIPNNQQCDRSLGSGDGICDIGATVVFFPPLDPGDAGGAQLNSCTPGKDVVVPAGSLLRLKSRVTKNTGRRDRDSLVLICRP